ncbi:neprilysin-4-like [Drosophila biarmipes]|uniref:neprilysin-4-like n=1 Tax=Drosophila biarmipes TaxID=125945 RepID=UPI001CDA9ED5|nr:neprilysin-4-like [Drosophila biarmipes]
MILCSISFRSAWLWGCLTSLALLELSTKGKARTVTGSKKDTSYLQSHADLMRSYMNFSVLPCDDFYEYACGNYRIVKPDRYSPEERSSAFDITYTLDDIAEQFLGRSDLAESLNVSSDLKIAQQFYNACLGADLYPFPAADPNYLGLIRSIGGFPAVDGAAWDASKFSWFNMSAHLINYGASGLIRDELSDAYPFWPQFKQPQLGFDSIIQLDSIDSNSSHAYLLNGKRMRGYLEAFQLPEDRIADVIDGVFAFWREALVAADKEDDSQECQAFNLTNYYDIVWQDNSTEELCHSYYVEIDKVCARHPEAVANYLAMKLLYKFDPLLSAAKYQRVYCRTALRTSMAFLFNKLYLAEYFTEEKKLEVSEIVQELRKGLRSSLEKADWLDPETREKALFKESTIRSVIGSAEDSLLTDRLIREINRLEVVDGNYAATVINLRRLSCDIRRFSARHSEELPKETLPQMVLLAMQIQAFYDPLGNSIYVMAGILQPPIYHRAWPLSLKFGTLGAAIGHELTHGFDTSGSRFDGGGKYRSWWSENSRRSFDKRAECFVDAYNKYLVPEIDRHVDGDASVDENIADSGGLSQALEAYRSHMQQLLEDPKHDGLSEQLAGLDLLPEQLFFLGFAQMYCADFEKEHLWNTILKEKVHTIDKYRVLGTLSNNDDFLQAFNCPVGSGMRAASETCRMW